MRRFGLRVGTWVLAGAVIASAAAAYAARPHVTSLRESGGHQLSTMRLIRDHPARDRGVLTYSKLTTVQARQTTSFEVEVTDVGRGPTGHICPCIRQPVRGTARRSHGRHRERAEHLQQRLDLHARSSARQAIVGPGRSATWRWDVAAKSPGEARILLVATSYRRGSKIVLDRTSDVVRVRIQATPLYFLDRSVDADRAVVFLALAVLVATGAVGAVLVLLRKTARGQAATPPRADTSVALTEPLRIPVAPIGRPAPAARPTLGWSTLLWLAPVDIAAGGLAMVVIRATTTKSPAFAIVAGAVIAGALPLYFLPLIIAYLRAAPDRASVAVINVLLGWTYLGWVAALALAVRDRPPDIAVGPGPGNSLPKYVTKRNPDGESGATHASRAALS